MVAIRLDGGLFFATSDALEDRIRGLIHATPGVTGLVLDCEGIDFIDSQGSAKLGDIVNLAEESGITLRLAGVKPAVRATLAKDAFSTGSGPTRSTATSTAPCGRITTPRQHHPVRHRPIGSLQSLTRAVVRIDPVGAL